MKLTRFGSGMCFYTRPWFHKALEVNVQRKAGKGGFDLYFRIKSKGDHPGLRFYVEMWGFLFEFEFHDVRHWDWVNDRYYRPGEELRELPPVGDEDE